MKNKKIQLIIKALIPVVIIAGCFGVEKIISAASGRLLNKPITVEMADLSEKSDTGSLEVINKESFGEVKGLTQNFGFINDNEILLGIGLSREEFNEKYPETADKTNNNNYVMLDERYYDAYSGKIYTYNLEDSTKKEINIDTKDVCSDLSIKGDKFTYINNDKSYIYDLNNQSKTYYQDIIINNGVETDYRGSWSNDGKHLLYYDNGNIMVNNVIDNSTRSFNIDSDKIDISMTQTYYSEDGQDIYFIGRKQVKSGGSIQGIYKLKTSSGEVEEKLVLPFNEENNSRRESGIDDSDYCILENGKRIIFNGVIEGIDGTYMCDLENDKFYNVIPHTAKSEEGRYVSSIWVSPDKTKVIYMNLSNEDGKEQWNLYAAKINGDSLTDRMCIYKDIDLCGRDVTWSSDSKKILFFTANEEIEQNNYYFKDKNEINIITFK